MWSDLEKAFFASAPPDEAEPPAAAETFDDLLPIPSPSKAVREWAPFGTFLAIPSPRAAARWDRGSGRVVRPTFATIALASVLTLLALSAVVFASLG